MVHKTFDADENYDILVDYCRKEGILIQGFINKVIEKELQKLGLIK